MLVFNQSNVLSVCNFQCEKSGREFAHGLASDRVHDLKSEAVCADAISVYKQESVLVVDSKGLDVIDWLELSAILRDLKPVLECLNAVLMRSRTEEKLSKVPAQDESLRIING